MTDRSSIDGLVGDRADRCDQVLLESAVAWTTQPSNYSGKLKAGYQSPETAGATVEPHHIETVRVEWADIDPSGHMHFTAGLRYAQRAEASIRRRLGILDDWVDYPLREVEATCHVMPRFDDEVQVRIRLESVAKTSLRWVWEIVRGDETCMEGRHCAVHVGSQLLPEPFPPEVRAALESLA